MESATKLRCIASTPSVFDTLAEPAAISVIIIRLRFVPITWLQQLIVSLQLPQCELSDPRETERTLVPIQKASNR